MKCQKCNRDNRPGRRFCAECGVQLMLVCISCKARNEVGERFCGQCGLFLEEGATLASPSLRALRSHTPPHLAEKILRSRSAVEGERKRVTVLFADVKGSMELLSEHDPEKAGAILDAVIEWMAEAVHCYEGTISQVAGDGIMALFGAPLAHEDHGLRACYAALRMHESMRRYGAETRHAYGIDVQIRIGLNSGEVVVSSIGNDSHMNYTAVGATVHLAARMEQTASPGTIRITDNVARLVEGQIDVKPLGPIPVKGLVHPVEAFEVMGAGSLRTRFQVSAARGLARFVGRDYELAELGRALDRAREGCGQVVALVGEAGVGKSRLIHEFARLPGTTERARVLACASVSCGKATSYMPAIDLLKDYFQIVQGDDHSSIRRKVSTVVAALGGALEAMVTPLLALLDVPVDEDWQKLDPPRRRQRMHDAVKGLLLRESRAKPLVVVFEDLHWIDAQMQALLDGLVESLLAAPLLPSPRQLSTRVPPRVGEQGTLHTAPPHVSVSRRCPRPVARCARQRSIGRGFEVRAGRTDRRQSALPGGEHSFPCPDRCSRGLSWCVPPRTLLRGARYPRYGASDSRRTYRSPRCRGQAAIAVGRRDRHVRQRGAPDAAPGDRGRAGGSAAGASGSTTGSGAAVRGDTIS